MGVVIRWSVSCSMNREKALLATECIPWKCHIERSVGIAVIVISEPGSLHYCSISLAHDTYDVKANFIIVRHVCFFFSPIWPRRNDITKSGRGVGIAPVMSSHEVLLIVVSKP